jgi:hypothetical protein
MSFFDDDLDFMLLDVEHGANKVPQIHEGSGEPPLPVDRASGMHAPFPTHAEPRHGAPHRGVMSGGDMSRGQLMALLSNGYAVEGPSALDHEATVDMTETMCRHTSDADRDSTRGIATLRNMLGMYGVEYSRSENRGQLCSKLLHHLWEQHNANTMYADPASDYAYSIYDDPTSDFLADVDSTPYAGPVPSRPITESVWRAAEHARVFFMTDRLATRIAAEPDLKYSDVKEDPEYAAFVHAPLLIVAQSRAGGIMMDLARAADEAHAVGDAIGRARATTLYALMSEVKHTLEAWAIEASKESMRRRK